MANTSVSATAPHGARAIPIDELGVESLLDALFPTTVREGKVDVGEVVRQCQYRAAAILGFANVESTDGRSTAVDAIEGARGYVAAANSLIDHVIDGGAK
jgi:hypothetical protein